MPDRKHGSALRVCAAAALLLALLVIGGSPVTAQQAGEQQVRVVAAAFRQDLSQVESYESFRAAVNEHFDTHVAPLLATDRPNLVVYPDRFDELVALIGTRGLTAREHLRGGGSPTEARGLLMAPYGPQIAYYRALHPGLDGNGRLLQLALTDTVVRAVVETFSQVAADHQAHLVVGVALPQYEEVSGPEAAVLGDPERGSLMAYKATTADIRAATLVLGPDGNVFARRDRLSITPGEAEAELGPGLVSASLAELEVVELPFARLGVVASDDAWMPDVVERYDQLRGNLLVQPLRAGPWAADRERFWIPDYLHRGTWLATQTYPSLHAAVTGVVTGNLGNQPFDGQPVVVTADGLGANLCLVGSEPEPGWVAVGPWGGLDVSPSALCGAERRPELRAASGSAYFDGATAADVSLPLPKVATGGHAPPAGFSQSVAVDTVAGSSLLSPHIAAAHGEAWLVAVRLQGNEQAVVAAHAGVDGAWTEFAPVAPQGSFFGRRDRGQWAPSIVVPVPQPAEKSPGLEVTHVAPPALVFAALGGTNWDVYSATYDRDTDHWGIRGRVDDHPSLFGFGPRVRAHSRPILRSPLDGSLFAIWSDLRWPYVKPQVRVARAPIGGSWSDRLRADGVPIRHAETEDEAVQPDGHEPDETHGQTFPTAALVGADQILVAWQESAADGTAAILLSRSTDGGKKFGAVQRVDGTQAASRRPVLAADDSRAWLVWEQAVDTGGSQVWFRMSVDEGRTWSDPRVLDPSTPPGTVQRRPAVVSVGIGEAVVVFEDDRSGSSDILAIALSRDGSTSALGRVNDGPTDSNAFVPTATLLGDGQLLVAWEDDRDGHHVRTASAMLPGIGSLPTSPSLLPGTGVEPATRLPATGGGVLGAVAVLVLALVTHRSRRLPRANRPRFNEGHGLPGADARFPTDDRFSVMNRIPNSYSLSEDIVLGPLRRHRSLIHLINRIMNGTLRESRRESGGIAKTR